MPRRGQRAADIDQAVMRQVVDQAGRAVLGDVAARGEEVEVIGRQLGADQILVAGGRELQLDVEGRDMRLALLRRREQAQIDVGVLAHEQRQEVAHEPEAGKAIGHDDLALAGHRFLRLACPAGRTLEQHAGCDHVVHDPGSLVSKHGPSRSTIEQFRAELALQTLDAAADRRLLHAKIGCRARKTTRLRHGGEDAEFVPVEIGACERRFPVDGSPVELGMPQYVFIGFRRHGAAVTFVSRIAIRRAFDTTIARGHPYGP